MPARMRLMVRLAMWAGLREYELLGLRRSDLDPAHRTVRVSQTAHQLDDGTIVFQTPKTDAGRRTVAYPASIDTEVADHLAASSTQGVTPGSSPAKRTARFAATSSAPSTGRPARPPGRPDLTLHDLRRTADTLAASMGASLPELMYRMEHATPHSALRYLHAPKERDRVLADLLPVLRPLAPVIPIKTVYRPTLNSARPPTF